jgi:Ca2+-binding RTX toxin-like protein
VRGVLIALAALMLAGAAPISGGQVMCMGEVATIVGTEENDKVRGTSERDVIHVLGGNDDVFPAGGDDVVCGGAGLDEIKVVQDAPAFIDLAAGYGTGAGAGTDTFESFEHARGTYLDDSLYGNGRSNKLFGMNGSDYLEGRGGNDKLLGGSGDNSGDGGPGRDRCTGGGMYTNCELP